MFSLFKKHIIDESPEEQLREFCEAISKSGAELEIQEDCDCILNSFGEFGRSHTNPIPVNGVLGEFKYLHRLRCKCNKPVYFHRLGGKKVEWLRGDLDVYEVVCYEGMHWDVLFFHLYHPRRSKMMPEGFTFSDFHPTYSRVPIIIGTDFYVETFPFGLTPYVKQFYGSNFNRIIDSISEAYEITLKIYPKKFERPHIQAIKIKEALTNVSSYSTYGSTKDDIEDKFVELVSTAFYSVDEQLKLEPITNLKIGLFNKLRCKLCLHTMNLGYVSRLVVEKMGQKGFDYLNNYTRGLAEIIYIKDTEVVNKIEELVLDKDLLLYLKNKIIKINHDYNDKKDIRTLFGSFLYQRQMVYHNAVGEKIWTLAKSDPDVVNPELFVDQVTKLFVQDYFGVNYENNFEFAFDFTLNISNRSFHIFSQEIERLFK